MKRIMLWKRDGRAASRGELDKAVACLAASVQNILNDDSVSVENKNVMLRDSFGQCLAHLGKLTKTKISLADVAALHRIFDVPRNKNLDVSVGEAGPDEGYPDEDKGEEDRDDDEGHFLGGGGNDRGTRQFDDEQRDKQMTTESHSLSNIVKRHGFVALAKSINAGLVTLTEEEYTGALVDDCARRGESFEKVFCANTPEGLEIRKGRERCRDESFLKAGTLMPIAPTQVGGRAARAVDNPKSALDQLNAMAQRMHDASPEMTLAQCFERTYQDPANVELKRREREEAHARLPTTGGGGGRIPI